MNKQLNKALEDLLWDKCSYYRVYGNVSTEEEFNANKAKILRVIELLVQQRDRWIKLRFDNDYASDIQATAIRNQNAELIAALEGK